MSQTQISTWLQFTLQQTAAESYLDQSRELRDILIDGNNDRRKIPETQFAGQTRMTTLQAQQFTQRYQIVDHHANDATGFSATLIKDLSDPTGKTFTLSFRSLEYQNQVDGGDWERDGLLGAAGEVATQGFAFGQLVSMERYYRELKADPSKLPPDAVLNITGYSLGGHLATVFTELHQTDIQHTYIFDGAGRGHISGGTLGLSEAEHIRDMLAGLEFNLLALDPEGTMFRSGAGGNVQADPRYQAALLATKAIYTTTIPTLSPGEVGSSQAFQKITQLFGHATHNDQEYVANSGIHAKATDVFIEDQPNVDGLGGLFDQRGSFGTTHSITLLVDSLALTERIQAITPTLSREAIERLYAASSSLTGSGFVGSTGLAEGNSLEKILDGLRKAFDPNAAPTPFGRQTNNFGSLTFRNQFYTNLEALRGQSAQIESLVDLPASAIASVARANTADGLAYRYALRELNPFVVRGVDYATLHNQGSVERRPLDLYDAQTGQGTWTAVALSDRADLLAEKLKFTLADGTPSNASTTLYEDQTTIFNNGRNATAREVVIFGDAEGGEFLGRAGNDHIYGGAGNDVISGFGGQDYLEGGTDDDTLDGGSENDILLGQQGTDTLRGGAGDDRLNGGLGDDQLDGGVGFDQYTYFSGQGHDTITDTDKLGSILFDRKIVVGGLHRHGEPDNTWKSLDGQFTFVKQGANLIINNSLTIQNFNFTTGALSIHLAEAPNTATPAAPDIDFSQPFPTTTVTYDDSTNTEFLNTISNNPLIVYALGGDDQISIGGDMNQVAFGGQGNDQLAASFGRDQLFGEDGNDVLFGFQGDDELDGGIGDDQLQGGLGEDYLSGGEGDDFIIGDYTLGNDADYIDGGEGNDNLGGGPGDDVILGGAGNDSLAGEGVTGGAVGLDGTTGNDFLDGGDGNDGVSGLAGDDILLGGNGNDLLNGDNFKNSPFAWNPQVDGEDYLDGGAGNDELIGGGFDDILLGGEGDDKLYGDGVGYHATSGADFLDGGEGDDELFGGEGEDTLVGGVGDDTLIGDFDDEVGAADILDGGEGDDLLQSGDGDDILLGGKGKDVLIGQDEDDFLQGGEANDELQGGQGDDLLEGDAGDDRLFGDDPNDLTVRAGNDQLDGGGGNDEIQAGLGSDIAFGGDGDDRLFGDAVVKNANPSNGGNDVLDGEAGDDVVVGNSGNDTLLGGSGDDYLDGGTGDDRLAGGAGNDFYVYDSFFGGIDTIDDVSKPGEENSLYFGAGISPDLLTFIHEEDQLIIRMPFLGGHAVVLEHFDPTGANGSLVVDTLQFFDGTTAPLTDFLERSGTPTDFDDVIFAGAGGGLVQGGRGNDRLDARAGDHRLIGGPGDDRLMGGDGSDTYVFNPGDGIDTIVDNSTETDHNTVEFGPGITSTMLINQLGSLLIRIGNGDDAIHIENFDPTDPYGTHAIDTFQFADGTSLTYRQLIDRGFDLTGTDGDDTITGTGATDRITGGTGNDRLVGQGGNDTYVFDPGWGQDRIFDRDITPGNVDVVRFGAGVNKDDVRVRHEGDDLRVFVRGTSDQLVIENYFANNSARYQVEQFQFADGTVWDTSIIQGMVTGGTQDDDFLYGTDGPNTLDGLAGDDQIYGFGGDDTLFGGLNEDVLDGGDGNDRLDGGFGVDTLLGGLGNDVYVFGRLSGDDTVVDADATSGNLDTILLDADVVPSDVVLRQTGKGDLVLRFQSQSLTVKGWGLNDANKVEQIHFGDGTIWDTATIKARTLQGTVEADDVVGYETNDTLTGNSGNDRLFGGFGDDVLDGGAGDDTLVGGKLTIGSMPTITLFFGGTGGQLNLGPSETFSGEGNDTYVFGAGSGQDTIFDHDLTAGNLDTLQLGTGLDPTNVTLRRMGDNHEDLKLTYFLNGDSITVDNWFGNDADKVEQVRFADGTLWGIEQIRLRTLVGSPGDDTIFGFDTSDIITGDTGKDVIDAGAGDDAVTGGDQNDVISGGLGSDTLDGGFDNDTLDGGIGNDTLIGGVGNDTLLGGNGGDTYRFEVGFGRDVIIDEDTTATDVSRIAFGPNADVHEIDRIVFGSTVLPGDVSIRRSDDDLLVRLPNTEDQITVRNWFQNDEKTYQVELIQFADGTKWDVETIKGLAIQGTAGDDTLIGYASADILDGGFGNDALIGGRGNDTYVFGPGYGQDTVTDHDVTVGNVDRIRVQADISQSDLTFRRGGNDLFLKVNGTTDQLRVVDWFTTEGRLEQFQFADGTVLAPTDINALILQATDTDDVIVGTDDNDVISGGGGNDFIDGVFGDDSLYGDAGFDTLMGGDGNDLLVGGAGSDSLSGGFGNDHLIGGGDSDQLFGDEDDDVLEGNESSDSLYGGDGYDDLDGGAGNDVLRGEAGTDTYHTYHGGGFDQIIDEGGGGGEGPRFAFDSGEYGESQTASNILVFGPGISPDDVSVQANENFLAIGLTNDPCDGTDDGVLIGEFNPSGGENAGSLAGAITRFLFDDGQVLSLDAILAKADEGVIGAQFGTDEDDRLLGSVANDQLYGSGGNDRLDARANADFVDGGDGDDVISAGSGQDTVYGGLGQDIIAGGHGDDFLQGGVGSDLYAFNGGDGSDAIVDEAESPLSSDIDTLSFGHGLAPSDIKGYVDASTGDLVLRAGGGDQLRISWFDPSDGFAPIETHRIERVQFIDGATVRVFDLAGMVDGLSSALRAADAGTAISLFTPATASFELASSLVAGGAEAAAYANRCDLFDVGATLVGGNEDNSFDGTPLSDTFQAGDGNNFIQAGEGDDLVTTGGGQDSILAGGGNDRVTSGAGDDIVALGDGADQVTGGAGNDVLFGDGGDDTYVFNVGDGVDTIVDTSAVGAGNSICFGPGISLRDLRLTVEDGALVVHVGTGGDAIRLSGFDPHNPFGSQTVDRFCFDGGIEIPFSQLLTSGITITGADGVDELTGTSAKDFIIAKGGDDVVQGGKGDDILEGGSGNDTYLFNVGDGIDIITDETAPANENCIKFGAGITADDLRVVVGADNVVINVGTNGDALILQGFDRTGAIGSLVVGALKFADGSQVNLADLIPAQSHAPVVANSIADQTRLEDVLYEFQLPGDTFSDTDFGDTLNYNATLANGNALPAWLSFNSITHTLSGTPDDIDVGELDLKLSVTDSAQLSASDTFRLTIVNVNERPTLVTPLIDQQAAEDSPFNFTVPSSTFTDEDFIHGDQHTYSASLATGNSLPSWLSFDAITNTLSGTPGEGDAGNLNITIKATDTGNLSATDMFVLTISGPLPLNLVGTPSDDILTGGRGNDTLMGGRGNDQLNGGKGHDTYVYNAGDGFDQITDPMGTDRVSFGNGFTFDNTAIRVAGTTAQLRFLDAEGCEQPAQGMNIALGAGGISTIESFVFTNGTAFTLSGLAIHTVTINGTNQNDVIRGGRHDETINAFQGQDRVYAGSGNDTVNLGNGKEQLPNFAFGEGGNDSLNGGNGKDILDGGCGDDVLSGFNGKDTLLGQDGNDRLLGGFGVDTIQGGQGDDAIDSGGDSDIILFGRRDGHDTLIGNSNNSGDAVQFGTSLTNLDLVLARQANDLRVSIHGTQDTFTINNWYSDKLNQVKQFEIPAGERLLNSKVDQLIQAMAGFSTQTGLTWDQAIDQRPQDVQTILAASWQ